LPKIFFLLWKFSVVNKDFILFILGGQQPLVPLLLLGPSFFQIILFGSTTLLSGMTGISWHMQWPLTSQSHGSVSQREQLFFCYGSNSTPLKSLFTYVGPVCVSLGRIDLFPSGKI
jgi:hypothetical protein